MSKSPFPGMDPYLEQFWRDVHHALITYSRDQLQRLYVNDPSCGGYGLYLVLWFNHQPRKYEGVRPDCPKELAETLERLIPEKDRNQIKVQVLDLSLPQNP